MTAPTRRLVLDFPTMGAYFHYEGRAMRRKTAELKFTKTVVRYVRPELTDEQVDRVARVIAESDRRERRSKTVDLVEIRAVRDIIRNILGEGPSPSLG